MSKYSSITEENIKFMVNSFYEKVKANNQLNFIFTDAIGESEEMWKPHLQKMYDFWSSVMLTTGKYHGRPMQKHSSLPDLKPELFDVWLELFEENAKELYTKDAANLFIEKSQMIAKSLKMGIFFKADKI